MEIKANRVVTSLSITVFATVKLLMQHLLNINEPLHLYKVL